MNRTKLLLCGVLAAGAIGALTPGAIASSDSPTPTPGSSSCSGLLVAAINHASGLFGPSGNPDASAGPGSFLGPITPVVIAVVRDEFC